jgi:hypothetical protein
MVEVYDSELKLAGRVEFLEDEIPRSAKVHEQYLVVSFNGGLNLLEFNSLKII